MIKITYDLSIYAWINTKKRIEEFIKTQGLRKICEIGGGASPLFSIDYVLENNLDYTVLDISKIELNKISPNYKIILADICAKDLEITERFDLVFSSMLMEHIIDAKLFHSNVYNLLKEGGFAFHFFPTLYAPIFILNKLLPNAISSILLDIFAPRDRFKFIKLPAYYNWCRGPTKRQMKGFEALNYEVLEYGGFFGLEAYYKKIPLLRYIDKKMTNFLICHPLPYLTAYAYVLLRKSAMPLACSKGVILSTK